MTERIGYIDQTPPGMSPLKTSTEVEGMLCLLEDIEKNKDRSIGQEKSSNKKGGKDFPQDTKDRRVRGGGQKQNDSS